MQTKQYYVYITTNQRNTVLYTGMTNNLIKRGFEHKSKLIQSFTTKYNVHKLVYYEIFNDIQESIRREKQIKGGSREKKIALIEKVNPEWKDLYESIL